MSTENILEMIGITKEFPGVKALDRVDFCVKKGEVRALVGENGAGKSTLIKILTGIYKKTSGSIILSKQEIEDFCPADTHNLGLSCIYQDQNFVPYFSIAESIFLSNVPLKKYGFVDRNEMYQRADELLKKLNLGLDSRTLIKDLTVSEQQLVQIAQALQSNPSIMILDEPTAPLSDDEVARLFKIINELKNDGVTIIYISHRLEEIFKIADTVTVLRNGKKIKTLAIPDTNQDDIIRLMVGKDVQEKYPKITTKLSREVLRVENYSRDQRVNNVSFQVRRGEVFGIYGVVGAGKTELARLIFGADNKDKGQLYIEGSKVLINSPHDAIKNGLAFVPEDRRKKGLVGSFSVKHNITLASLLKYALKGFIQFSQERQISNKYVKDLDIKTPSIETLVRLLSGGNQQKVVLAKWLSSKAKVFILDQPTIGVDVGAKTEIYKLIGSLVKNGAGVIFISAEIPEIINLTDRVGIMRNGHMKKIIQTKDTNPQQLLAYAIKGGDIA